MAFVISSVLIASTSAALAWAAGQQEPGKTDDEVVVQFTPPEQAPAPEPPASEPPPSAPMVVPDSVKVNPAAPRPRPLVAPDDDRAKLREADPSEDKGVAGVHSDQAANAEPGGMGTGSGALPSSRPPPPPPEDKKEPPKGIATISEGTTPPVPISTPIPAYPAELRSEGAETRVVCKIKIAASGSVAGGKCFQGDARFHPASIAALRSWRFKPAIGPDGQPVEFVKTVVFPFAIRN